MWAEPQQHLQPRSTTQAGYVDVYVNVNFEAKKHSMNDLEKQLHYPLGDALSFSTLVLPSHGKPFTGMHQTTFAMGESIAHPHYLWYEGKLVRTLGADGVYRFFAHTHATQTAPKIC
jgi:hypothetical protein